METPSDGESFLERLLAVSMENPKFTLDDVLAETATILTGVSTLSPSIMFFINFCLFLNRQQIHHLQHRHLWHSC